MRQTITTDKNQPRIDYKTEIWVKVGGIEGWFTASFPCDCNEIYAGIPFGSEKRNPDKENYGSFERKMENVFFGKHFVFFNAEKTPMAILQGNCEIYYKAEGKQCELFLMKGLKSTERMQRSEKWIGFISEDYNAEGHSSFEYSVYFPKQADSFDELHRAAYQIAYPLFSSARMYCDTNNCVSKMQLMNIKRGELVMSAVYRDGERYVLRMLAPIGAAGNAEIEISLPFKSAFLSDFLGNKKRNAEVSKNKIEFDYLPHEIVTVIIKRK